MVIIDFCGYFFYYDFARKRLYMNLWTLIIFMYELSVHRLWSILLRLIATPAWQYNIVYIIITVSFIYTYLILCLDISKQRMLARTCCIYKVKRDAKIKMFLFCKFIAIASEEEQITCVTTWRFFKMF